MHRTDYEQLNRDLAALSEDVTDPLAVLANASALLYERLEDLNWAGFYRMKDGRLILGPFQGKPACVEIAVGRGVCGTAVAEKKTQLVDNVHEFPGHIACDGASNSEIVVPFVFAGQIAGVLDIDSPVFCRFSSDDRAGLEAFVSVLEAILSRLPCSACTLI